MILRHNLNIRNDFKTQFKNKSIFFIKSPDTEQCNFGRNLLLLPNLMTVLAGIDITLQE